MEHGWLKGAGCTYFIDMPLADFSLHEYIQYLAGRTSAPMSIVNPSPFAPILVHKECSELERLANSFEIGAQIARGIQFLHSHKLVHRDIKPSNGTLRTFKKLIPVLFYRFERTWKLADFGICSNGTSRSLSTQMSRGTPGYRAPELLRDDAKYTNKVDIWALGCLLHELITGDRVFNSDWAVGEYFRDNSPAISIRLTSSFWQHHVGECVRSLLSKDGKQRPKALLVCQSIALYSELLAQPYAHVLDLCQSYPTYLQWSTLVEACAGQTHTLPFHLAQYYYSSNVGMSDVDLIVDALAQGYVDNSVRTTSIKQFYSAKLAEELRETTPMIPIIARFLSRLGAVLSMKGHRDKAVALYVDVIGVAHLSWLFWSYHKACELYMEDCMLETAITFCEEGINRFPDSPAPILVLTNLYGSNGKYDEAYKTRRLLYRYEYKYQWVHIQSALRDFPQYFVPSPRQSETTLTSP